MTKVILKLLPKDGKQSDDTKAKEDTIQQKIKNHKKMINLQNQLKSQNVKTKIIKLTQTLIIAISQIQKTVKDKMAIQI